jgi:hypothetical protein
MPHLDRFFKITRLASSPNSLRIPRPCIVPEPFLRPAVTSLPLAQLGQLLGSQFQLRNGGKYWMQERLITSAMDGATVCGLVMPLARRALWFWPMVRSRSIAVAHRSPARGASNGPPPCFGLARAKTIGYSTRLLRPMDFDCSAHLNMCLMRPMFWLTTPRDNPHSTIFRMTVCNAIGPNSVTGLRPYRSFTCGNDRP